VASTDVGEVVVVFSPGSVVAVVVIFVSNAVAVAVSVAALAEEATDRCCVAPRDDP
jgi:hypothetical protein